MAFQEWFQKNNLKNLKDFLPKISIFQYTVYYLYLNQMLYQNDNELSLDITGRMKVMVLAGSNTYNNPV